MDWSLRGQSDLPDWAPAHHGDVDMTVPILEEWSVIETGVPFDDDKYCAAVARSGDKCKAPRSKNDRYCIGHMKQVAKGTVVDAIKVA